MTGTHTHDDPQGQPITHAHDLGAKEDWDTTYDPDRHTHLVVLSERNFVNWYTGPARDWEGEGQ